MAETACSLATGRYRPECVQVCTLPVNAAGDFPMSAGEPSFVFSVTENPADGFSGRTGCFTRGLMQSAFAVRMVERPGRFPVEEGGFPAGGYRFSGGVCGGGREVAGGRGGFRVILEEVSGWRWKNRRAGRWCGGWPAGCCSVVWGLPEGFRFMPERCRNRCGERYRPGRWRGRRG